MTEGYPDLEDDYYTFDYEEDELVAVEYQGIHWIYFQTETCITEESD